MAFPAPSTSTRRTRQSGTIGSWQEQQPTPPLSLEEDVEAGSEGTTGPPAKGARVLLTPATCDSAVASLDDSRSPVLPVRLDLVGLGYDPRGPAAQSPSITFSPRSPTPPPPSSAMAKTITATTTSSSSSSFARGPAASSSSSLILQGVTASFNSGDLVAVMGPSGSGKSTLLRLIHGDHRYLRGVRGSVLVNGTPLQAMHGAWRQLCSLVPQEDVLLGAFTVRETLLFSAHLRLPPQRSLEEKEAVLDAVLGDLGMRECADVRVQAISGGQRRRVSVGLELVSNPSVLILDEPTSGLDSKTAEDLCQLLKSLSQPGRLVVCSIHQPSFRIFSSFSRLCFLVKGRLAFTGAFEEVMPYFERRGFSVPTFENPSDFYMRVMQTEGPALTEAWASAAPPIAYPSLASHGNGGGGSSKVPSGATSPLGRLSAKMTWKAATVVGGNSSNEEVVVPWDPQGRWLQTPEARRRRKAHATPSAWQQYRVLLHRFLADSYKDRGKMLSGVLMEGAIGLLIGLVWYQQDVHDSGSAFAVAGVFIMLTTIAIFDNCVSVGLKFPLTRALHFREFSNGYYSLAPYYLATVTSSLLLSATYQLIQAVLVFFLVGLHFTPLKFAAYLWVLAMAAGMGAFLGFIVGTHTSDLKRTQELLTPILMPLILFSGYMLPLPQLQPYLRPLYYASFYQYTFSSLLQLHFTGLAFHECTVRNPFCVRHGEDYLRLLGLDPALLPRNLAVCVAFLLALILLGYLSLRRVSL